ncbi:MAG: hypothetical protein IKX86_02960 [Clostridia bacterium]|nr:hypothetical protein [Clostridia bacterium]
MKDKTKTETRRLTVSSLLAALSVVLLYVGAVSNFFSLTAVAVVSLLELFAVEEIGSPYKYAVYIVTGFLSALLLPDKFTALAYIVFGGVYPMLRTYFEKLKKPFSIVAKLVYFNLILTGLIAASLFVLAVEDEEMGFNLITYGLGNLAFIAYEYTLSMILALYRHSLRDRLRVDRIFNNRNEADHD